VQAINASTELCNVSKRHVQPALRSYAGCMQPANKLHCARPSQAPALTDVMWWWRELLLSEWTMNNIHNTHQFMHVHCHEQPVIIDILCDKYICIKIFTTDCTNFSILSLLGYPTAPDQLAALNLQMKHKLGLCLQSQRSVSTNRPLVTESDCRCQLQYNDVPNWDVVYYCAYFILPVWTIFC
jgi:hypothetical protein